MNPYTKEGAGAAILRLFMQFGNWKFSPAPIDSGYDQLSFSGAAYGVPFKLATQGIASLPGVLWGGLQIVARGPLCAESFSGSPTFQSPSGG